jgi:hypothetical protein
MMTVEQFWIERSGVWRTARRPLYCGECKRDVIAPGDRYLDTGERKEVWATWKCCAQCAAKAV